MSFEQRMEARKLKEAQETAEYQKKLSAKESPKLLEFPATISMNILAPDWNEAKITLKMLIENLNKFDDLSNVESID